MSEFGWSNWSKGTFRRVPRWGSALEDCLSTSITFLHLVKKKGSLLSGCLEVILTTSSPRGTLTHTAPSSLSADDDWYTLYGALASGKDTFFVSNDLLTDKTDAIRGTVLSTDPSVWFLLNRWKESCQVFHRQTPITVRRFTTVLKIERSYFKHC